MSSKNSTKIPCGGFNLDTTQLKLNDHKQLSTVLTGGGTRLVERVVKTDEFADIIKFNGQIYRKINDSKILSGFFYDWAQYAIVTNYVNTTESYDITGFNKIVLPSGVEAYVEKLNKFVLTESGIYFSTSSGSFSDFNEIKNVEFYEVFPFFGSANDVIFTESSNYFKGKIGVFALTEPNCTLGQLALYSRWAKGCHYVIFTDSGIVFVSSPSRGDLSYTYLKDNAEVFAGSVREGDYFNKTLIFTKERRYFSDSIYLYSSSFDKYKVTINDNGELVTTAISSAQS